MNHSKVDLESYLISSVFIICGIIDEHLTQTQDSIKYPQGIIKLGKQLYLQQSSKLTSLTSKPPVFDEN